MLEIITASVEDGDSAKEVGHTNIKEIEFRRGYRFPFMRLSPRLQNKTNEGIGEDIEICAYRCGGNTRIS
jgi:hypothetical protein